MEELLRSLALFKPETALVAGLLLVVIADSIGAAWRNAAVRLLTLASLAVALGLAFNLQHSGAKASIFSGMLVVDPLGAAFKVVLVAAGLLTVLVFTFRNSRELQGLGQGEFHALVLALVLSCLLLASASDLVMLYLALEMVSITSYVMVAYLKGDRMANEASLKYVLFGAASTGSMLYGLSFLYGMTGTTSLPAIQAFLAGGILEANRFAIYAITLLVLAGFGFKIAAVPFHFWCPDVYQGAATPVTALLSVLPKAAGLAIALRFFYGTLSAPGTAPWDLEGSIGWGSILMLISVLTMTLGNVAALTQTNMKRLLAYSSIAHAGYLLMGIVALSENGARGLLVYLAAYLFMNLGAFLVVTLVHLHEGSFDLRDYAGLHRRAPLLTVAMAFFLLSLVGIPPFIGFLGKLYVFAAVIEKGMGVYATIAAVNAAIAAYYYFRVLKVMTIDAGNEDKPALNLALADRAWLVAFALANLVPLLFWSQVEGWARSALVLYAGR
ncbi:MAG TPA: NADH-quinone oxidoreductase subunit N [Vicinamibacteria bacterium]|nr:NADH-quinone oxidoreductase subunit N [Vicinamibacteria bacterium]